MMNNYKLTAPVLAIPCDQIASPTVAASKFDCPTSISLGSNMKEVLRIEPDGRLIWKGREVESDDELRSAMLEIKRYLTQEAA